MFPIVSLVTGLLWDALTFLKLRMRRQLQDLSPERTLRTRVKQDRGAWVLLLLTSLNVFVHMDIFRCRRILQNFCCPLALVTFFNMASYVYVPRNPLHDWHFSLLITVGIPFKSLLRSYYAIPMEYNNKDRRYILVAILGEWVLRNTGIAYNYHEEILKCIPWLKECIWCLGLHLKLKLV